MEKNYQAFAEKAGICYVSESGEGYNYQQVLEIAKGNEQLARVIFDLLDWQHPETVFEELLREEEIDEEGNILTI